MYDIYNKIMIKLSSNATEANNYLEELGLFSLEDKIGYLEKLFNVQLISKKDVIGCTEEEKKIMDYYALLNSVILIK